MCTAWDRNLSGLNASSSCPALVTKLTAEVARTVSYLATVKQRTNGWVRLLQAYLTQPNPYLRTGSIFFLSRICLRKLGATVPQVAFDAMQHQRTYSSIPLF